MKILNWEMEFDWHFSVVSVNRREPEAWKALLHGGARHRDLHSSGGADLRPVALGGFLISHMILTYRYVA